LKAFPLCSCITALTSEINGDLSLKDIYITTSHRGKSRPLIGPFNGHVTVNASWCRHSGSKYLPKLLVAMKTGVVEVHIGPGHVMCLTELIQNFNEFLLVGLLLRLF
jgi:vacuolar protein sorting-associated protein 13B